jgi:hypothetical protein
MLASSSVLLLSGCGSHFNLGQGPAAGPAQAGPMHGTVYGGQAPVTGATVKIYEIGATSGTAGGYAAALSAALGTATTDGSGNWSMTPAACTNANDELYVVASGGMEIGNATPNSALVMTSVGGPCGSQFTHAFNIDEITTVATEYALAGFSSDYQHVGTSAGNAIGLTHAFATVNNIVNLSLGTAYTATPAYLSAPANTSPDVFRSIVPDDTINSLANVLASCVNASAGSADAACQNLFALTGGVGNTADATLQMAHNPGTNVSSILALPTPQAPFGPTLTISPHDVTLTVNYVGGGLGGVRTTTRSGAFYIAIDQQGNVWVPNKLRGTVTELDYLGKPLSPNTTINLVSPFAPILIGGYSGLGLSPNAAGQVAIDQTGNAWVADPSGCMVGIQPTGAPLTGSPFTANCPIAGSSGIAVDANNNIWVAGTASGNSFISSANNAGTLNAGFPVTAGFNTLIGALNADYSGHMWYVDGGNGEFGALNSTGSLFATTGTVLATPTSLAAFGTSGSALRLWIPEGGLTDNIQTGNVTSPPTTGPAYLPSPEVGPGGIMADGANNFFLANVGNGGTTPSNVTVLTSAGAELSPTTTGYNGGSGLTTLNQSAGLAIDQSGNVWVVNQTNWNNTGNPTSTSYTNSNGTPYLGANLAGTANVSEIIGFAAPTNPVLSQSAKAGTLGGVAAAGAYGVKP